MMENDGVCREHRYERRNDAGCAETALVGGNTTRSTGATVDTRLLATKFLRTLAIP